MAIKTDVDAALAELFNMLPDELEEQDILKVLSSMALAYTENSMESTSLLLKAAQAARTYYAINGEGACMCPGCIAERKRVAN
jgi:hypothetical protein